jgi:two-component system response regulator HydG
MHNAGRLDEMLESDRFRTCFQGGKYPREGEGDEHSEKDARLGDLYLAIGNVNEALAYYKRALASIRENDDQARLEVALKASACLRRQSQSQEALSFVESVLGSFTGRCRRDLLAEKATLLCHVGRYGEAVRVCEEAQKQEVGGDREKDARIYLVLGHVLARLCRWQQAIVCLEQAAAFGRMCGDLTTRGNALNNLGIVYKNLCRFNESAAFLGKAVKIARQQHNDASLAVRLLNLANTLFKMGSTEKAHKAVLECRRIATTLNLGRTRIQSSICLARIEMVKGEWDAARVGIEQALSYTSQIDDPRLILIARETLADLLLEQGSFQEAREILEECANSVSLHAKDVNAELKTRLAAAYIALGHRKKARACAEAAAGIAESIGDLYEAGRALRLMAVTAAENSSEYLSRAERLFDRMGAQLELGITLHTKSRLRGIDEKTSVECLERAIRIFRRCDARRRMVRSLCSLALAYEGAMEHEKALTCLAEAGRLGGGRLEFQLVSKTRLKVDDSFSCRFAAKPMDRLLSADDAVSLLRSRFGVRAVVLAQETDGGPARVVKVWGISHGDAGDLVRVVADKDCNPLIYSNVKEIMAPAGKSDDVGSLLAVRFGVQHSKSILIACWPADTISAYGGARPHLMVAAYYEISHRFPVFETAAEPRRFLSQPLCVGGIITADRCLKSILLSLPRIAKGSANVLITGETGTGKELVARAIHAMSPRCKKPLVIQNCAALPEQLLESELFGHKAGAFTGAKGDKKGLLEIAEGGTFLLDEVGDVSPSIQAKMLRAIETGEIRRLGDTVSCSVDARFLSATNKNLEEEVEAGRFRGDLYYRLNVVAVNLPPLRDRHHDVELLSLFFLARFARTIGKPVKGISDDAMRAMVAYTWPGNVRQLENEVEKSVTMVEPGRAITPDLLSPSVAGLRRERRSLGLKDELRTIEKRRIVDALNRCAWNKTHAARLLGDLSRPALVAKMKRLGIPLKPAGGDGLIGG